MSMNCFLMKSMRAIAAPKAKEGLKRAAIIATGAEA
jgi:hypothetical protein